jgi:hypothetical protein
LEALSSSQKICTAVRRVIATYSAAHKNRRRIGSDRNRPRSTAG